MKKYSPYPFRLTIVWLLAAFAALVAIYPQHAIAQASATDLGFCMNGSGSISPADFSLQKSGIQSALQNAQIFPRNGSIGFTLVQYANSVAQVHVPYRVISTEADVQTIIAQVNAITQIQGCTNPGNGINVAMSQLLTNGGANNQKIICLFTDGLPNCGASTPLAIANAQANGLDRFTVIGIEDPPFYYEADFQSYYGPYVFGGGAVTVAHSTVEFANFVGNSCLFADTELIGLEVNQAIQDWNNSVELVEHKTTYVRAHVKSLTGSAANFSARLRAYQGGTELAGSPLTAGGGSFQAQVTPDRSNWNHTVNFQLPPAWTTGTVRFKLEAVGGGLTCSEAAGPTAMDCETMVSFLSTDVPDVKYVRILWLDGLNPYFASSTDITELDNRLTSILPVSDVDYTSSFWPWLLSTPPVLSEVLPQLQLAQKLDIFLGFSNASRLYYGVLKGPNGSAGGGLGFLPGTVSCGYMPDSPFIRGRNRHAHEMAHNLNRDHTGICANEITIGGSAFPYSASVNGMTVAAIGPSPNDPTSNQSIYGLDNYLLSKPDFVNGVIEPTNHFELMSYCGNNFRWISDFTYEGLRSQINALYMPPPPNSSSAYMIIRGIVDLNTNTASFHPFLDIETTTSLPAPSGNYNLILKNASGSVLSTIPFQPEEMHADLPETDPDKALFIISVIKDPNIKQVEVRKNGTTIGSLLASSNVPLVNVTFPNGGEFLSNPMVNVQWTASDADNDPLKYTVQYSKDNGANWQTLAVDLPSTSLAVPLSELEQTNQALIRIIASDGFNSAFDQSNATFTTPNNPPILSLVTPYDGAIFSGVQPVFFEASVYDKEQGSLSGGSISWTSNLNGFLGSGESFYLTANLLAEGTHIITATATDGGGLSDSKMVQIQIFRIGGTGCGGMEICNGLDDDCDGLIDDSDPNVTGQSIWYTDSDGDGFGDTNSMITACSQPAGTVNISGDCNDTNANIKPGAIEICNGLDDNCDGIIDRLVYNGNVTLSTQAKVDAFAQCYSVINGNLLIQNAGVINLSNLSNLTTVTNNVTIKLTSLTNLNGLNNLTTIGGNLNISINNYGTKLSSLYGLEELNSVGGNILIYYNFSLTDCCAIRDMLGTPGAVGGTVSIYNNKSGCDNFNEIISGCIAMPLIEQAQPSFSSIQEEPGILLFPNPAINEVKLVFPFDFQRGMVKMFDIQGRLIVKQSLEQNTPILHLDLSKAESGIYIVKVQIDDHLFIEKLVVE